MGTERRRPSRVRGRELFHHHHDGVVANWVRRDFGVGVVALIHAWSNHVRHVAESKVEIPILCHVPRVDGSGAAIRADGYAWRSTRASGRIRFHLLKGVEPTPIAIQLRPRDLGGEHPAHRRGNVNDGCAHEVAVRLGVALGRHKVGRVDLRSTLQTKPPIFLACLANRVRSKLPVNFGHPVGHVSKLPDVDGRARVPRNPARPHRPSEWDVAVTGDVIVPDLGARVGRVPSGRRGQFRARGIVYHDGRIRQVGRADVVGSAHPSRGSALRINGLLAEVNVGRRGVGDGDVVEHRPTLHAAPGHDHRGNLRGASLVSGRVPQAD